VLFLTKTDKSAVFTMPSLNFFQELPSFFKNYTMSISTTQKSILPSQDKYKLLNLESLFIQQQQPDLNLDSASYPLRFFIYHNDCFCLLYAVCDSAFSQISSVT